jgi:hypothetical protein
MAESRDGTHLSTWENPIPLKYRASTKHMYTVCPLVAVLKKIFISVNPGAGSNAMRCTWFPTMYVVGSCALACIAMATSNAASRMDLSDVVCMFPNESCEMVVLIDLKILRRQQWLMRFVRQRYECANKTSCVCGENNDLDADMSLARMPFAAHKLHGVSASEDYASRDADWLGKNHGHTDAPWKTRLSP